MSDTDLVAAATEAYIYGYPLVYNMSEIAKLPAGSGTIFSEAVPWNTFAPARQLLDPTAKFVSPNNDTLYLIGPLDLGNGPVVLHVPDTSDRYYVLQFVDAWTNNVAYIGRRATGTAEAEYLLAPPGFLGEAPAGMTVVELPSTVAIIVGRVQVDGDADLPAVHALQDQFTLRPPDPAQPAPVGLPAPDPGVAADLTFWEQLRTYVAAFPPPEGDAEFVAVLDRLGVTAAESPFVTPDSALAAALVEGAKRGRAMIDQLAGGSADQPAWSTAKHMFDYNLDRCGPGTIDSPEWKIADRKKAYVTRAVIARAGLWGNHGYEANYDFAWLDANGDALVGSHTYELTFSPPPPAKAFWSLTMYDTPDFYLVDNPIERYSIGDRTPGLQYGPDGAVTIYLQTDSPGPERASNWLPTPAGAFRPILRTYEPGAAILDGSYQLPDVRRTD